MCVSVVDAGRNCALSDLSPTGASEWVQEWDAVAPPAFATAMMRRGPNRRQVLATLRAETGRRPGTVDFDLELPERIRALGKWVQRVSPSAPGNRPFKRLRSSALPISAGGHRPAVNPLEQLDL